MAITLPTNNTDKPTLYTIQGLGPLQRSYKWNLSFDVTGDTTKFGNLIELLKTVNLRCISASCPTPVFDPPVKAAPHGIDIVEPGIIHLNGEIDFTIVETTDLKSRRILYALQQYAMADEAKEQYNIHGTGTGDIDYEITAHLFRLDNKNTENLHYLCHKCFIGGFQDPAFASTTGDVEPSFKLVYNYFEIEFGDETTVTDTTETDESVEKANTP